MLKFIAKLINKSNLINLTMIETIKVSSRGQIVIPERVREELGIEEGEKLVLIKDQNRVILEKENDFLQSLRDREERKSWIALGEKAFSKIWDNKKDERVWKKYL